VAARTGRNPTTGQAMSLPATVKPRFVPGAIFKAKVKG
jgi:nucleoid DNA-binding protein